MPARATSRSVSRRSYATGLGATPAGASAFLGERTLHRNLEVGVSPGHLPERIEDVAGVGVNGTLHRMKTAHDLLLAPLAVRVIRVEVSAGTSSTLPVGLALWPRSHPQRATAEPFGASTY